MMQKENKNTLRPMHDLGIALLLFGIVGVVYGMTLCRSIYTGDDGDFITAMATWGNCHPTGYPLFLLIGHLFLWALSPVIENPAVRINFMTALAGAASIGFFYRFLVALDIERFWAAAGALFLAFTPTLWQQSLSCEVYSLTCLLLSAIFYIAAVWYRDPSNIRLLRLLAFVYGLACTNHLTIVLFLPGFLVFVLMVRKTLWREWQVLLSLMGLFLVPLLFYAYLPIAALGNPPVNWGDPSTLETFWSKITGLQYQDNMFRSFATAWRGVSAYGKLLWAEFTPWFLWLVPVGAVALWRDKSREWCLLLFYIWVADVVYAINYGIFDVYVYYIPSYIVAGIFIVSGASSLLRLAFHRSGLSTERRSHYTALIAAIALVVPLVHMSLHYMAADKSGNFMEDDFSANILASCPKNALVITGSNVTFTLWYRRFVLGERQEVVMVNRNLLRGAIYERAWYYRHLLRMWPELEKAAPGKTLTEEDFLHSDYLIRMIEFALRSHKPVIWVGDVTTDTARDPKMSTTFNTMIDNNFTRVPYGIGERLYLKTESPDPASLFRENESLWGKMHFRGLLAWSHADPLQEHISLRYGKAFLDWGKICEREHRYKDAIVAYNHVLEMYNLRDAIAGLERCKTALSEETVPNHDSLQIKQ
jgi:hypothetical protein